MNLGAAAAVVHLHLRLPLRRARKKSFGEGERKAADGEGEEGRLIELQRPSALIFPPGYPKGRAPSVLPEATMDDHIDRGGGMKQ